jgi:hypothetical protein
MSSPGTAHALHWPVEPVDPAVARVDYDVRADEFLVYFDGKPVPKLSDPLIAPGFRAVSIMFGADDDDELTGEIVGVHIIPMLLGAVQDHPRWAVLAWAALAGDDDMGLLRERLPGFLQEIEAAFRQFGTPLLD